jgi:hypothetical protein
MCLRWHVGLPADQVQDQNDVCDCLLDLVGSDVWSVFVAKRGEENSPP